MLDIHGFFSLEQDRQCCSQFTWIMICPRPGIPPPTSHARSWGFVAVKAGMLTESLIRQIGDTGSLSVDFLMTFSKVNERKKRRKTGKMQRERNKPTIPATPLLRGCGSLSNTHYRPWCSRSCASNTAQDQKQDPLHLHPHRELRHKSLLSLGLLQTRCQALQLCTCGWHEVASIVHDNG